MARYTTPVSSVTFIGIDYHKRFSVVVLGDKDGNMVQRHKLINDERLVREFFLPYTGARCVIESCRGFEWFVDLLKDIGLLVTVCDPRRVKLIAESRNKTDNRDAKVLMELGQRLSAGVLSAKPRRTSVARALALESTSDENIHTH